MESAETIAARASRLQAGLETAFGVRARSLDTALRRTGRRMPRRLHNQARRIVDAQAYGGQPKLMRQLDGAALDAAEARVLEYLGKIDRADRRKDRLLGIAAAAAFNILIVLIGCVFWLWWSGRI